jgi:hypothetical protein
MTSTSPPPPPTTERYLASFFSGTTEETVRVIYPNQVETFLPGDGKIPPRAILRLTKQQSIQGQPGVKLVPMGQVFKVS